MILVTGATGCVGRAVVERLVSSGHGVKCLWHWYREHGAFRKVVITGGDTRNTASLVEAMTEGGTCDTVIHLASIRRESSTESYEDVNVAGTRNVVEACKTAKIPRLIHVNCLGGETRSPFPFLRSMGKAEESIKASGLNFTVLKSAVVYGDGDWLTSWLSGIAHSMPFVMPLPHEGRTKLQPIWVGDLASCVVRCLNTRSTFRQVVPVGGPQSLTVAEIAQTTLRATRKDRRLMRVPSRFTSALNTVVQRCRGALTEAELNSLIYNRTTEIGGVHRVFGFVPAKMSSKLSHLGAADTASAGQPVRFA
jgi:NADH dehydrogenase